MWEADVLSQLGLHIAGKNMALIDIYHLHTILFIILSLKKSTKKVLKVKLMQWICWHGSLWGE